jgi:hypothetical protein
VSASARNATAADQRRSLHTLTAIPLTPMSATLAPPPEIPPETWRALFGAAADFARLRPWEAIYDSQVVGWSDPGSGETRIGCVLGNAGEVFGAVFYRRPAGMRWILSMLTEDADPMDLGHAEGMDCLKLEFVPKRELKKADRAVLEAAGFKPAGRGPVWPQFRAAEPGWHPWYITPAEAGQFSVDLPRLTAFCALLLAEPDLYDGHAPPELPFLPSPMPERALRREDLHWQPLVPPPGQDYAPFEAGVEDLAGLRALRMMPDSTSEYDCALLPGGSFVENGRPCYGRVCLLVEQRRGRILGFDLSGGATPPGEAAGRGLVKTLAGSGILPGRLMIRGERLQPVLAPLCAALGIRLEAAATLPACDEALASLGHFMQGGR